MKKLKKFLPLSFKGWAVYLVSITVASLTCVLLRSVRFSDTYAPMVFVLAVLITSLLSDGYFYGILTALTSVFAVNWIFTYPYMELDFSLYGYPLAFTCMAAVGFAVSTLTTRLKAQERIKRESEQEKTRANLLRALSHDLRTPLTSISGSIGTVLEDDNSLSPQQRQELLSDAKADAEWLCRMVENLLSITRIGDGGPAQLQKLPELPEEVIGETVEKFLRRNPDIKVHVDIPSELIFVPMDAMLIEQVLLNLLDNAHVHGKSTENIHISTDLRDNSYIISVSDDGQGIAPQLMDRLFDGSLQLQNGQSADKNRFMGIGLSVCRTIIQAHGGSINAWNLPQGGACFSFTLPLGDEVYDHSGQDTDS